MDSRGSRALALTRRWGARNYNPLPVVLVRGRGTRVWDTAGKEYLDFLSAYSALNQGHNHPAIAAAVRAQLTRLCLTSRAFHHDRLGPFLRKLCRATRTDRALPMNSGAEAVETAIKAMRLWAYRRKGVPEGRARIVVCRDNFHGRTTALVGFSSDPATREGFGPATPGFDPIPFGDAGALERAIRPETAGFLVEPVQGEAGVILPPPGYLRRVREICRRRRVLLCADEIQTGLGRTGRMLACMHEGVSPDLLVVGKALSGGFYPVSALCGREEVMGLFTPGTHGSTFGGNPLACAAGEAALDVLAREGLPRRAARLGEDFLRSLKKLRHPRLREARGLGLLLALEFDVPVRPLAERLAERGLLVKDTHESILRLAPPLTVREAELKKALAILAGALAQWAPRAPRPG